MLAGHFEHGFAVEWMRKDLAICLDEARRNGASLAMGALIDQFYGRWREWEEALDTSSLFARTEALGRGTRERAGAPLSPRRSAQCIARCRARHSGKGGAFPPLSLRAVARQAGVSHAAPLPSLRKSTRRSLSNCHGRVRGASPRLVAASSRPGLEDDRSQASAPPICASSRGAPRWVR